MLLLLLLGGVLGWAITAVKRDFQAADALANILTGSSISFAAALIANGGTLFIDEIGTIDEHNRPQLVQFCKEHNFLPIFAAPQPYDGFSKYYFIFRSKGKINLNDKQHAVRREDLNLLNN